MFGCMPPSSGGSRRTLWCIHMYMCFGIVDLVFFSVDRVASSPVIERETQWLNIEYSLV